MNEPLVRQMLESAQWAAEIWTAEYGFVACCPWCCGISPRLVQKRNMRIAEYGHYDDCPYLMIDSDDAL